MCDVDDIRVICVRGPNANRVYVAVDLTNGQLTPNNNTPLLAQALSGEAALCVVSPALLYITHISSYSLDSIKIPLSLHYSTLNLRRGI